MTVTAQVTSGIMEKCVVFTKIKNEKEEEKYVQAKIVRNWRNLDFHFVNFTVVRLELLEFQIAQMRRFNLGLIVAPVIYAKNAKKGTGI